MRLGSNPRLQDVSVHAGEGTFQRVPEHVTPARVYYLHIFDSNRKYFFWMQNPDTSQDDANCSTIRTFLETPPPSPPPPSRHTNTTTTSLHSFTSHHLDPADIQHLLSIYRNSSASLPSPTNFSSSSSSSSSPSDPFSASSRKWIANPAWTPPATRPGLTGLPGLLPHAHLTDPLPDPVRVPRVRAVCAAAPSPDLTPSASSPASPLPAEISHIGATQSPPLAPSSPIQSDQGIYHLS